LGHAGVTTDTVVTEHAHRRNGRWARGRGNAARTRRRDQRCEGIDEAHERCRDSENEPGQVARETPGFAGLVTPAVKNPAGE
jgi:hypothetical protein